MSCSYAAPFCDTVRLFGSRLSPKVTIPADFHIKDRQGQQYITNRMLYAILSSCHACSSNAFSSPINYLQAVRTVLAQPTFRLCTWLSILVATWTSFIVHWMLEGCFNRSSPMCQHEHCHYFTQLLHTCANYRKAPTWPSIQGLCPRTQLGQGRRHGFRPGWVKIFREDSAR